MDSVQWTETEIQEPDASGLPHATHHGVLKIGEVELRCYRLSDGRSIFHAEDLCEFFGEILT